MSSPENGSRGEIRSILLDGVNVWGPSRNKKKSEQESLFFQYLNFFLPSAGMRLGR